MGWFDFLRASGASAVQTLSLPLFPLDAVLFPGGLLSLRIFEQRYLDMAAACLKDQAPFGLCLAMPGGEGTTAPQPVGSLAMITHWDMEQLGILQVTVHGGRRFRILHHETSAGGLLQGTVELLAEPAPAPLPQAREKLLPLLQRVANDLGPERIALPHRFNEAEWVGYRLCEILPIQNLARQKLLELEDPLARLEIIEKYLAQRNLL